MALLLRVITKPKWVIPEWADDPEDVPADALTDLRTTNNGLSVWSIDYDKTNLDSVLVAAAASRARLDKLDYLLFDEQVLSKLNITSVRSDGATPHATANRTMHRDLVELTADKLAGLAKAMMPGQRVRVSAKDVKLKLQKHLEDGALDSDRIADTLRNELRPPANDGPES